MKLRQFYQNERGDAAGALVGLILLGVLLFPILDMLSIGILKLLGH